MLPIRRFSFLMIAISVLFLQSTIAGAQTTSGDVSKKTGEAWDTLKAYGADKKEEAVEYGKGLLKEADSKISELKQKSAKVSGETKAHYDKAINDLKPARERAATKLDEMKAASQSTWEATKKGFADAYKELHQAYDKAAERLK